MEIKASGVSSKHPNSKDFRLVLWHFLAIT